MGRKFELEGPKGKICGETELCTDTSGRACLVMAHGFRGSMEGGGRARHMAQMLAPLVTTVRFDFSWCAPLTLEIKELRSVLDFVRKEIMPEKLYLLGRSLGGAASVMTACGEEEGYRPDGLILWATPNDLEETFVNVLGKDVYQRLLGGEDIWMEDERGKDLIRSGFVRDIKQYDLDRAIRKWQGRPVLFIHGEKDAVVPLRQAERNFEVAGREGSFCVIKDADHHISTGYSEAQRAVEKWLGEQIKKA